VHLTVVGAGPAYSDRAGSTGAAYLVRDGVTSVLFDIGQGAFPRLAATIEPSRLTAVVISHLHPDHFIDLVPLRHYLRYEFQPPRRVRVIGPAALAARIDALLGEAGFTAANLDCEPVGGATAGPFLLEQVALESRRVVHTDESYGFRVGPAARTGAGLVYSGDCGRADDLVTLIRPGDTLMAEVSFGAGPVPPGALHLDGPAVGALAAECRAGRVLLTHLQMGFDPAAAIESVRARFDGPVELVEPGAEFEV
jgi:ribonuclease BN (tRNA processing enzyme)